ncbi:MAG TPA: MerR family transcriptional regulator [Rectinemataceae bacterium]|nr:MerR family transcriptional regulator [Rectinemataceae bacterium]
MDYTVKRLATMAGVSVRTLHHYDAIGLLSPGGRSPAGYRLYGEAELMRLQQILFFRELEIPLEEIKAVLDRPDFDALTALEGHRRLLAERAGRIARLIDTVDRTIGRIKGETMLTDEELYEGFAPERVQEIKAEAEARWGGTQAWAESRKRMSAMTKESWAAVKAEGAAIDEAILAAMKAGLAPGSAEVQALMGRKFAHLRNFYEPTREMFAGLGRLYCEEGGFRSHYDAMGPGLCEYLREAMEVFAR